MITTNFFNDQAQYLKAGRDVFINDTKTTRFTLSASSLVIDDVLTVTSSTGEPVTCVSSDTAVINVVEGVITAVGAGEATLTLTCNAAEGYDPGYKEVTMSVEKKTPTCEFAESGITVTTLGVQPTLVELTCNSDGAKTWESSDTAVATIDTSTGEVTTIADGETTISVSVAATDEYAAATASYVLTVAQ